MSHFFFRLFTPKVPTRERQKHTYILGGTGSGKSEMLKTLVYEELVKNADAIVVLDPKGDLAREIAKFVEHTLPGRKDKLVYLSPFDFEGYTPVLNPFHLPPVPPSHYEKLVDITTRELADTLNNIFTEMDSSGGFTGLMLSVLAPCIETIIRKNGDGDFWDLMRFFDEDRNHDLVTMGKASPNESVRRFFERDFQRLLPSTKDGIKWRVRNLLNSQVFAKLTTGRSTIHLKQLVEERKCIIFNLDKGSMGSMPSNSFGKLVVSLLQVIAMQRGGLPEREKVPTHLFIDEFHNYITMSIKHVLAESRSNKLFLIAAQQLIGQDMPDRFKKILLGNTNIKILGKSSNENYKELSSEFGIPVDQLHALPEYYFYVKVANGYAFRIKGRSSLVKDKNAMPASLWRAVVKEQLERYYVPDMQGIGAKRIEDELLQQQYPRQAKPSRGQPKRKTKEDSDQSPKKDDPTTDEPPFPFS